MSNFREANGSHRRTKCRDRVIIRLGLASLLLAGCSNQPANDPVVDEQSTPQASIEPQASTESSEREDNWVRPANGILRHAVFFKFKDDSTPDQVEGVVQAFQDLPNKIDAIVDFQWGVNNSPEGLDDGFTHCFLLSFQDDAGRSIYLPHDAHKAFGDVLRPHMDKVFVIDYWGQAGETSGKELKHAVFFKFKPDAEAQAVQAIETRFAALPEKIDAIKGFEWGRNNSPEKHDEGFTHCFMVTFDSEEGRAEYLPHPEHKAFVEALMPVLEKVRVLDFWATE